MKKIFIVIMICIFCIMPIMFTGCQKSNNDVEKMQTLEVFEKTIIKMDETNLALTTACTQEPENRTVNTDGIGQNYVGSFGKTSLAEYIARLEFGYYIFYNVAYAIQNNFMNSKNNYSKTMYGTATETSDPNLNAFLLATNSSTKIAVTLFKEKNGIGFVVDWDIRNSLFNTSNDYDLYNTVYMVNGYIEYDNQNNSVVSISLNTYQILKSGQFFSCYFNFKNNTFSLLEGYRTSVWNKYYQQDQPAKISTLYNNNTLNYQNLCNYPYNGIIVATGNISDNINDVDFNGIWKFCNDINNSNGNYNQSNITENEFANLYNSQYEILSSLKLRDENDLQSLKNANFVPEINNALKYGTNKTTCIFIRDQNTQKYSSCNLTYIKYNDILILLDEIKTILIEKHVTTKIIDLINSTKNLLNSLTKEQYYGCFEMKTISFSITQTNSTLIRWNCYLCDDYCYTITELNTNCHLSFRINQGHAEITEYME